MSQQVITLRRRRLPLAAVIVLVQLSSLGFNKSQINGTVPFRLHDHLIVVSANVGECKDLELAVDTGSTFTVVSRRVGRQLGLKGETVRVSSLGSKVELKRVTLDRLSLGEVSFENVEARLADSSGFMGLPLDGLIGLDLLRRVPVRLDFTRRELSFGQVRVLPHATRFYSGLNFIPVTMRVQNRVLRLTLDTGACGLMLYHTAVKDRFEMRKTDRIEYRSHAGGRLRMEEVAVSGVSLGASTWDELPGYLMYGTESGNEHVMGNLGPSCLGLKVLQLDFEKGELSWQD